MMITQELYIISGINILINKYSIFPDMALFVNLTIF